MRTLLIATSLLSLISVGCGSSSNQSTLNDEPTTIMPSAEKTSNLSYEEAFAKAEKEKKPLLILVGARWCASCQVMKRDTIEPMKSSGDLKDVVTVLIDKDERPDLADQLMRGETLPQVVVFSQESGNWKRFSLTGMQNKSRIVELLQRASAK